MNDVFIFLKSEAVNLYISPVAMEMCRKMKFCGTLKGCEVLFQKFEKRSKQEK